MICEKRSVTGRVGAASIRHALHVRKRCLHDGEDSGEEKMRAEADNFPLPLWERVRVRGSPARDSGVSPLP
jgi:hypothetical protein